MPNRAGKHTLEEVLAAMKAARVPAGPILSTMDLLEEPQFVQRRVAGRARGAGRSLGRGRPAAITRTGSACHERGTGSARPPALPA